MDNRQDRLSCMRKSVEWLRLVGSVKGLFLLKQNSIKFHLYAQVYTRRMKRGPTHFILTLFVLPYQRKINQNARKATIFPKNLTLFDESEQPLFVVIYCAINESRSVELYVHRLQPRIKNAQDR